MMRPWLGLLLIAGVALVGAEAVPPIITVKNLKLKSGSSYRWDVKSRLVQPLNGSLYPGQSGVAKLAVDVQRSTAGQGYVVSGRIAVTNPSLNTESITVTALKVSWGPTIPLVTPFPQQLDCAGSELQPGDNMACSFRLQVSNRRINTLTPILLVKGSPQLQGEPVQLDWPEPDSTSSSSSGSSGSGDSSECVLITDEVQTGDLQPAVQIKGSSAQVEDLLNAGVEVCEAAASFNIEVEVGPVSESSGLCGNYQIKNAPQVRFSGGSIGTSSTSAASIPVTISGCRQKDILGGPKPLIAISKLSYSKVISYEWKADAHSSANTSSPAIVNYSDSVPVDVSLALTRKEKPSLLAVEGELTITNTQLLPYLLPVNGVRVALSQPNSEGKTYVTAVCPTSSTIVVSPQLGSVPGKLNCTFKAPLDASWSSGTIQAQLQTLLSATFEVDSGPAQPFDFRTAAVAEVKQGDCVSLTLTRVTNQKDLQSANSNPAVAELAHSLGSDAFHLLPAGKPDFSADRAPPVAGDLLAAPYVVCDSETVTWREVYGPFTNLDCGAGMALMGVTAKPQTGSEPGANATLAFPIAVKNCTLKPNLELVEMHTTSNEVFAWSVDSSKAPAEDLTKISYKHSQAVKYQVNYKRTSTLSGFKLQGLFKVVNPHDAELGIDSIYYTITRPTGKDLTGEAFCSGTISEAASMASAAGIRPQIAGASTSGRPARMRFNSRAAGGGLKTAQDMESDEADEADGPLFCSFDVHLPDDFPGQVQLVAVTDQGVKATSDLGTIDWSKAEKFETNKCAMASFSFSDAKHTLTPSRVEGNAPPALAVQICEPQQYSFTAFFGPWGPTACGLKSFASTASISIPSTASVLNAEAAGNMDVHGCPGVLPNVVLDAAQARVKRTYTWSIVRRLTAMGANSKHVEPAVTVAGPGSPVSEPGVLALTATHSAVSTPGAYAKFNETITLKRSKQSQKYDDDEARFEVKGEVKIINEANKPLQVSRVLVKITSEDEGSEPITIKAVCPKKFYVHDEDSDKLVISVPAAGSYGHLVKCHYGALVTGPGAVTVNAVAILPDNRKAPAKHKIHLELEDSFLKPISLGSCIRVRELQAVRDSLTGTNVNAMSIQGGRIPEEGTELCSTKSFSFVARVGPLEDVSGQGCQAVTYTSQVEAIPSSGYQGKLKSEGVVEIQTKTCKQAKESNGSEDSSKTYKGSSLHSHKNKQDLNVNGFVQDEDTEDEEGDISTAAVDVDSLWADNDAPETAGDTGATDESFIEAAV